jgi:phage gpG-like protein
MASIKIKSLEKLPLVRREAVILFKAVGVSHFKRNFRKQGFYKGRLFIPWKRKKKDDGKRILNNSGALQRSIKAIGSDLNSVTFGSPLDYANVHNKGFKGVQKVGAFTRNYKRKAKSGRKGKPITQEVKAHTRIQNIPKRTFINANKKLEKELANKLKRALKKFT